jgi:DNA-binding MarR family transcriptional regulator
MLLSKVLLAFAIEYERESHLSLAISANVLRVATGEEILIRDLPRVSGASKEAIAMAVKRLEKSGLVIVQVETKGRRVRTLSLTAKGHQARDLYGQLVWDIEKRWEAGFCEAVLCLRQSLERLVEEYPESQSPLFRGLEPYPDGWRASIPKRQVLPHYPMVLHRGGFPDGS